MGNEGDERGLLFFFFFPIHSVFIYDSSILYMAGIYDN